MFCEPCQTFPTMADTASSLFSGSSNFRIDSLISHDTNQKHRKCLEAFNARENPSMAPLNRLLSTIPSGTADKLTKLFRTAYYVAKNARPFSDFAGLCDLQNLNGCNLGKTYLNDHKCSEFIDAVNDVMKEGLKAILTDGRSFSVMCDGSTDAGKKKMYCTFR